MRSFVEQDVTCLIRFDMTKRFTFEMACDLGGLWLISRVQQLSTFFFPVQLLTGHQFLYCKESLL